MSELFIHAPVLTVSELNAQAKQLLENGFQGIWVSGEVSNLIQASSGHYYFSLKDTQAQVRCVLFKYLVQQLTVPLKEGDYIEVKAKVSIYEARGDFQITVNEIRQLGLGQLYERYEQLKSQLQKEGLFSSEIKQKLPENPRCIGVVTSLAAAALRDVVTTLKRRSPHIPVIVYPTMVQGVGSEQQIAQAILEADKRAEVDVLIVCRGGGSIEDLWSFNEEVVVRAIAACRLPVVSGVGHETDFTLCDFVADVRAPTPTAAAELVSPNLTDFIRKVKIFEQSLHYALQQYYHRVSQKVDLLAQHLLHPNQRVVVQKNQLLSYQQQLNYLMQQILFRQKQVMLQNKHLLFIHCPDLKQSWQKLLQNKKELSKEVSQFVLRYQQRLSQQKHLLDAVSPQNVLERGFAVVKDTRGRVVVDRGALKLGQKLQLILAKGEVEVQVSGDLLQRELFD